MNDFYVYVHRRLSDNKIFYVGKGKNKRAFEKSDRNSKWTNIANAHGFKVEFAVAHMEELDALKLEQDMIAWFGKENLANVTDGGEGFSGYSYMLNMTEAEKEVWSKNHSSVVSNWHNTLTPEQKQEQLKKQSIGAKKFLEALTEEEYNRMMVKSKECFDKWRNNLTEEERIRISAQISAAQSIPIIVNRSVIYKSFTHASEDLFGVSVTCLWGAHKNSINKGYTGTIYRGKLVELYDPEVHTSLLNATDFVFNSKLPNTSSPVMDDTTLFLSFNEAAASLGKSKLSAEFISARMRKNLKAFGHSWRKATVEEINKVLVDTLVDNTRYNNKGYTL